MAMRSIAVIVLAAASSIAASVRAQSAPGPLVDPMQLVYTPPPRCPGEQALMDAIAVRLRARPFDPSAPARLLVTLQRAGARYQGTATLHDASGAVVWTVEIPPASRDCAVVMDALAFSIGVELTPKRRVEPPAEPPPVEKAGPPAMPSATVTPPVPQIPPTSPARPAEPPNVPNPARVAATRVAIAAYVVSAVFAGFGVAWTVDARNKSNAARSLAAQLNKAGGGDACTPAGAATADGCARLVSTFQSADTAGGYRNIWYAIAGTFAAIGITSTLVAFSLPSTGRGQPAARLSIVPAGLVLQGSL